MKNTIVTLKDGREVDFKVIEAQKEEEIRCICHKCKVAYIVRPYVCKCRSNVFLEDIKIIKG